jgi:hypothetical protein
MAGLDPAIHGSRLLRYRRGDHGRPNALKTFAFAQHEKRTCIKDAWMAATSAAMTQDEASDEV